MINVVQAETTFLDAIINLYNMFMSARSSADKIMDKTGPFPQELLPMAYYPLAQQSCGGDIGSVPYVCM